MGEVGRQIRAALSELDRVEKFGRADDQIIDLLVAIIRLLLAQLAARGYTIE